MSHTGNKGEWSELYVLLRLLADGRLYAADADLRRLEDVFFPILKIFRTEESLGNLVYVIGTDDRPVELYLNGDKIKRIPRKKLDGYARTLYEAIVDAKGKSSFAIAESERIMDDLRLRSIKAPSTDKTDIRMEIHDLRTGNRANAGFSIKSELGAAPTLLNASSATNFVYEVLGVSTDRMAAINAIDGTRKIVERMKAVCEEGSLSFCGAAHPVFAGNLMLIDSRMEEIVGNVLLLHYTEQIDRVADLVTALEERDPMGFARPGMYRYKMKKLLGAIALGMIPSRPWNGQDEANGGYIVVLQSGAVVAYHIYQRDAFESYLLNHTRLERGSSSRHGFARLYEAAGRRFVKLNLQIRFL